MLNFILRNNARIDFCDPVVAIVYERVKIRPLASPYIIIPPGCIIIYERTKGNILKQRNVVDHNIRVREVEILIYINS